MALIATEKPLLRCTATITRWQMSATSECSSRIPCLCFVDYEITFFIYLDAMFRCLHCFVRCVAHVFGHGKVAVRKPFSLLHLLTVTATTDVDNSFPLIQTKILEAGSSV